MIEFVQNFFMKFSGARWWGYFDPENWEGIAIASLIFLGIFSIITIVWLIVRVFKDEERNRRNRWGERITSEITNLSTRKHRILIKPWIFFIYFIFSTLTHILVMIMGMTIGGIIGWGVCLVVWAICHLVSIISQNDEGDGEITGIFEIFGWVDQYANKIAEFMLHREKLKENYQKYLKIEY